MTTFYYDLYDDAGYIGELKTSKPASLWETQEQKGNVIRMELTKVD